MLFHFFYVVTMVLVFMRNKMLYGYLVYNIVTITTYLFDILIHSLTVYIYLTFSSSRRGIFTVTSRRKNIFISTKYAWYMHIKY